MKALAMFWRNLPLRSKGIVVVAIPVIPLIGMAALYFEIDRGRRHAEDAVERTWRLRNAMVRVHSLVLEGESAVRGFLLVGQSKWLSHYELARTRLPEVLADLDRELVDPHQRGQLRQLRELVEARLQRFTTTLDLRGQSEHATASLMRGEELTARIAALLNEMIARNQELLTARRASAAAVEHRQRTVVILGTVLGVGGGVLAAFLFTTGVARRLEVTARSADALGRGERLLHLGVAADEIGALAGSLDRAASLLEARDKELRRGLDDLAAANRELEAFSYSVSHDLRAPLRHITGFAAMLTKSAAGNLTQQQQRYTSTITQSAARMGRLIDDLLAFSRTGRAEMRMRTVDLGAIVKATQQELAPEINGRSLTWAVNPLPQVKGDASLLKVVFDNLLSNAVKYTRHAGSARIEVGTCAAPDEQVVWVRDNGAGFDMQYQDKLFGVFQRLHGTDEFEGTGIGLATVRRIMARHGGRSWAEGRVGAGATFFISFPNQEAATV